MAEVNGAAREFPRVVPDVEIQLDRLRHLRFDMQAVIDAEILYSNLRKGGRDYSLYEIANGGTSLGLSVLLWAGLRHEEPALTLEQVNGLYRPNDINRISRAINKAVFDQVTTAEEDKIILGDGEQKKTDSIPESSNGGGAVPLPG